MVARLESQEDLSSSESEGRLGGEVAHEEANMMRAYLKADERGQVSKPLWPDHPWPQYREYPRRMENPTPEDYDKALEAVEEIKRLAEEEPESQKTMYKIGRILQRAGHATALVVVAFGSIFTSPRAIASLEDHQKKMRERMDDAEKRLRDLKRAAEKFAKRERR